MKVLLVDDEIITLEMLRNLIPWDNLNLELAGCAQDGEEAYEMIQNDAPDIVITDIRMRNMDGLQLVENILAISDRIKIILMSAYAEFQYVKKGIRLGCSNYILKPIDENELIETLQKVIDEIKGKQNIEKLVDKSEKEIRMLELYKYMSLGSNRNKIQKYKEEYEIPFRKYAVAIFQKNNSSFDDYINMNNMELIEDGYALNTMETFLKEWYNKDFLSLGYEDDAWIILIEDSSIEELGIIGKEVITYFRENLGLELLLCFSEIGRSLNELPKLYEQADSLRKYAFYIGDESILGYETSCKEKKFEEVRKIGLLREAEQAIQVNDSQHLQQIIDKMFQKSLNYHPDVLQEVCEFCYQIIYLIRRELGNDGKEEEEKKFTVSYEELKKNSSEKNLRNIMMQAVAVIEKRGAQEKKEHFSKPVQESLKIIEENYNKNLSLDEISEKIAVSKNYFCYMFKREVGISIWNYLTHVRLRHAKEMLEKTEMRTYEIAFQVGYDNPSYFSKIFKKTESMTPNEYRESKR